MPLSHRTLLRPLLVFVAGALVATSLAAQPSPRLVADDPAYADIDLLVSGGLVRTVIYGQRPWTEREVQRITREAEARARALGAAIGPATNAGAREASVPAPNRWRGRPEVLQALLRLRSRFPATADTAPDRSAAVRHQFSWRQDAGYLDAPPIRLANAPVGDLRASVTPLLTGQTGRPIGQGVTLAAEPSWSATVGRHLLVHVRPRAAVTGRGEARTATLALQEGSVAVSASNLVAEVGRQAIMWGPGLDGGLLLSGSGRPLDAIRVRTDAPFRAPSLLRWLGLLRGEALFADLGAGQNFPHAKVGAYRLSGQVTSYFEFAAAVLVQGGGRGAPSVPLRERVIDFIPALKYTMEDNDTQFSNKFAGWDWRVRIPQWHGLQLWSESVFDDMDPRRWRSTFVEDGGHLFGVSLAPLGPARSAGIAPTLEFRHTGLRFYRHTVFASGLTFNSTMLGDPLGPQGDGVTLRLVRVHPTGRRLQADLTVERRGTDLWSTTADNDNNDGFRFVLAESRPADWRQRLIVQADLGVHAGGRTSLLTGVERARGGVPAPGVTPTTMSPGSWARHHLLLGLRWTTTPATH